MPQPLLLDSQVAAQVPETYRLLQAGNLTVHPRVESVALGGSRGLSGNYRPDSDIDLTLIVRPIGLPIGPALGSLLEVVLRTTLENWQGSVELDLAAVFDTNHCGLVCFGKMDFDLTICCGSGTDCFGLYKIQRGFSGFVAPIGVQVKQMNPTLILWQRTKSAL